MIVTKNLCESILIGSDFLTQHNCILNFSNLTLSVSDTVIPLLKTSDCFKNRKHIKVNIAKTASIPPKTVVHNVKCYLKSQHTKKCCYITTSGIVDPADALLNKKFGIKSPNLLVNFKRGKSYLQITNPNEFEITIYKNQTFGNLETVTSRTVNHLNGISPPNEHNLETAENDNSSQVNTVKETSSSNQTWAPPPPPINSTRRRRR